MSEFLDSSPVSPDAYQHFVASTQFDLGAEWEPQYADWIRSESMEFLGQHGPGALLVMPDSFELDRPDVHHRFPELRNQMLDELGDLVWFGFSVAERNGIKAMDASKHALTNHGVSVDQPLDSFDDLSELVRRRAGDIGVANKISVLMPEADEAIKTTHLNENPFYVLQRTVARLCRALNDTSHEGILPSMTDLEAPTEIMQAIGDYLNVLAYIASVHLDADLRSAVSINMAKLQRRQIHGKE